MDRSTYVGTASPQPDLQERPGHAGSWQKRWEALSANLSLTAELSARGFDAQSIEALSQRAWDLRNISIHSGDAVLLSLGYPPEREQPLRRRPPISGSELAPLHVREGIEAPFATVHLGSRGTVGADARVRVRRCGSWEKQFR